MPFEEELLAARPLPFDIFDPAQKAELDLKIRTWIEEDSQVARNYWAEWDDVDERLNGTKVPVGWSTEYSAALATKNDPTVSHETKGMLRSFVTVNRTRPNHESQLGDSISIRRRLSIRGRTPRDMRKGRVLQRRVEYEEDDEMLPEQIYLPAMDGAWGKGLHWIDVSYDPRARSLKGKIGVQEISCRDVLVDHHSRGPCFKTGNHRIQKTKVDVEDAKKMFRQNPLFNPNLSGDNEYEEAYNLNQDRQMDSKSATFYKVHFRQIESTFYRLNPNEPEGVEQIGEDLFFQLDGDSKTRDTVFEGEQETAYYIAMYHTTDGTFSLKYNPTKMWLLFPLIDMHTELRLMPLGDVKVYSPLQDLLDTLVTVFLENAKKMNIPIAELDENTWEEHQTRIEHALRHGGGAVGIKQIFNTQPINQHLTILIPWVIQWIQDSISKHAASRGELPAKQIAKETFARLIERDRTAHGRKDVMIKWTLTQLAKAIVRLVSLFEREPDFFPLLDQRRGMPGWVPINQEWTEAEYISSLADISGIPVPEQPVLDNLPPELVEETASQFQEEELNFEREMIRIRREFEIENDVKITFEPGFIIEDVEVRGEDVVQSAQDNDMSVEEYVEQTQAQPGQIRIFQVNMLESDPNLSINYGVDEDFRNDPEFQMQQALLLNERGLMGGIDTLKRMKIMDPEGIHERAQAENQAIQIAKVIAENPELQQQFVQLVEAGVNGQGAKG